MNLLITILRNFLSMIFFKKKSHPPSLPQGRNFKSFHFKWNLKSLLQKTLSLKIHIAQFALVSLLIFSIISCSKNKQENNDIGIIGHGGIGFQSARNVLPHNSMESLTKALSAYKISGVEVDVQLSKNGTLWMYHDEELWSMTLCESCISESSDETLENCRYRNDFAVNIVGKFYLAMLEELFVYHQQNKLESLIVLDVRTNSKCIANPNESINYKNLLAEKINELIEKYNLEKHVWVGAEDKYFLEQINALNSNLLLFLEGSANSENIEYAISKSYFKGFVLKNDETNTSDIELLRSLNFVSIVFGVKTTLSHESALSKNPDYIMSDNVQLSLNALR